MVKRFVVQGDGAVTPFKMIIDEMSVKENEARQRERTSLYASDYGQCMRKVWYQFFPEQFPPEGKIDARVARIFANGNDVHVRLGSYLKMREDIDFHDELSVPLDELNVHGRCDGIATWNDQEVVLEFKSINKEEMKEPKEEHVGQLLWYMYQFAKLRDALRAEFGVQGIVTEEQMLLMASSFGRSFHGLTPLEKRLLLSQGDIKGEIIYELKGTQTTVHFPIEYDEGKIQNVKVWFETVKKHVDGKTVPVVKYVPSRYPCSWKNSRCQYFEYCHGAKCASLDGAGD